MSDAPPRRATAGPSPRFSAAALASLHHAAFAPPETGPAAWSETALSSAVGPGVLWIEIGAATPLAFGAVRLVGPEAEVLTLARAPACRGQGLGSALLQAICTDLTGFAVESLVLEVSASNKPALQLYQSFDFSEIGRRPAAYQRPGRLALDAVVMSRAIGA